MSVSQDPCRRGDDTSFVVRAAFQRSFAAGDLVYDVGEDGSTLFVVQEGQVELMRPAAEGEEADRVVDRLGPGEFFGEMGVLMGRPRTMRAVATSEAQILEVDGATFEGMCVDQPEIAIRVIQRMANRMIDLEQRLAALGVDDLLRPMVRVLVRSAEPADQGACIPLDLRSLAARAGFSILEAHRALGQLFDRKIVRLVDDVLEVPDLEALSAALD